MHEINEQPVLWIAEFARGLCALVLINIFSGIWTVRVIHSELSPYSKLPVCLIGFAFLNALAFHCFDPKTHLIGSCVSAVSLGFTAPLQAAAWLLRKVANPSEPTSDREIILRIAIPAASPSVRHPAESPYTQVLRGTIYLYLGISSIHLFDEYLRIGGVRLDIISMFLLATCATATLNFSSAALGLFGFPSPPPFRCPVLSPTLAQFWAGRWNAPVSDSLRVAIYDPLRKIHGWSKPAACMACFFVSGVAHELVLLYCGVHDSHGEWFCFFMLSGASILLESKVHAIVASPLLRWAFAVGAFFTLFHCLFVPVAVRTGYARAGVLAMDAGPILVKHFYAKYFGV